MEDTALYKPPPPAPMEVTILSEPPKGGEYCYVMFPSGKMAYVKEDRLIRHTKKAAV